MQFTQSQTWHLTSADCASSSQDAVAHILAPRLLDTEAVKFVFTCGSMWVCFTSWRMICIDQPSGALIRTVSTLPYRHIVTLETGEFVSDAPCAVMRSIRFTCGYGFAGTLLFADPAAVFPPEQLTVLEMLMTAGMA